MSRPFAMSLTARHRGARLHTPSVLALEIEPVRPAKRPAPRKTARPRADRAAPLGQMDGATPAG